MVKKIRQGSVSITYGIRKHTTWPMHTHTHTHTLDCGPCLIFTWTHGFLE